GHKGAGRGRREGARVRAQGRRGGAVERRAEERAPDVVIGDRVLGRGQVHVAAVDDGVAVADRVAGVVVGGREGALGERDRLGLGRGHGGRGEGRGLAAVGGGRGVRDRA